jgi:hypothetical protein
MKWTLAASFLLRDWGQDKRRERAKKLALAAGVAAITAVDQSHAATITYASTGNGSTVVYVVGEFAYGDENTFAQTTAPLSRVFVSFHSPGGNLLAGIGIGKIIHARGYTTYVGAGSLCGSACATAWLGALDGLPVRKRKLPSMQHPKVGANPHLAMRFWERIWLRSA